MSTRNKSYQADQQSRNTKFMEFISKQMMKTRHRQSQISKPKESRNSSSNAKNNASEVREIYSHQQLPKQRRGASILRNNSKYRYQESMSQMKTNILKDSAMNFYHGLGKTTSNKMDSANTLSMFGNFQQDMDIEEIHYEMVKMMQEAKRVLKKT